MGENKIMSHSHVHSGLNNPFNVIGTDSVWSDAVRDYFHNHKVTLNSGSPNYTYLDSSTDFQWYPEDTGSITEAHVYDERPLEAFSPEYISPEYTSPFKRLQAANINLQTRIMELEAEVKRLRAAIVPKDSISDLKKEVLNWPK